MPFQSSRRIGRYRSDWVIWVGYMIDAVAAFDRPVWLDERIFPFQSRFTAVQGHEIHYVDEGAGPVVLFIHGNPDYSLLYRHQVAGLRDRYRCVALDMPGFGLSVAADGFGFTPSEQSAAVEAFIQHLDLRDAVMVVHDWGGPIGLRAAERLHDRFVGLIITGTLAWPDYRRTVPWWGRLMMGYLASERGRAITLKNNFILEGPLRSEMNKGTHPPDDAIKAAYRGPFPTAESRLPTWVLAHHLWTEAGEPFLTDLEGDLERLRPLPVLLAFGGADRFTPPDKSIPRFADAFPNHHSVIIADAGHFFPESSPVQLTDAIRDWLDHNISGT